jgi:hypothetical protein
MCKEAVQLYKAIVNQQSHFHSEEDVRVHCEAVFTSFFKSMGIHYNARYEVKIATGAVDALYNNLCIEYKKPGLLKHKFDIFVGEKEKYIRGLAQKYHTQENQIFCVLLDGCQIGFFRKNIEGDIVKQGPFDLSPDILDYFIHLIRSFNRKALVSENLIIDIGEKSPTTHLLVRELWMSFNHSSSTRTRMFFYEWARMFGQVSDFGSGKDSIIREASNYGITIQTEDISKFIFVLHTTYAIYIKLIALMIMRSLNNREAVTFPEVMQPQGIRHFADELEKGTEFSNLGIRNFLEGDFFCWYTKDWNEPLDGAFRQLCSILNHYEPSSVSLKPEVIRDLLKELYQGLMSKSMRHSLGEYYTPDWLAELTIKESGWHPNQTILDPTCGSGTFLVHLINKTTSYLYSQKVSNKDIVAHVLSHIYGFDLNPLAVISARTNYLIALSPFMDGVGQVEIPIYLTDSIFSPQREGNYYHYHITTQEGKLQLRLPSVLFEKNKLHDVLNHIEHLVQLSTGEKAVISEEEAEKALKKWNLSEEEDLSLCNLLHQIRLLEEKDWNGIWCSIIKNHFTTATLHDFDILIGNPPWLRWSALPDAYRETIKNFCKDYGLFSSDVFYGGIESDVSTMVLYSAAQKWLKKNGRLAMLITRSVFKTESSEGFRAFTIDEATGDYFKVLKVHDLTKLKPFQDAENKASLIVLNREGTTTTYPLPWIEWKKVARFTEYDSLHHVLERTDRTNLVAHPIQSKTDPWLTVKAEELSDCLSLARGGNERHYAARKGVCTDMNGIYYGRVKAEKGEFLLFENDPSLGRRQLNIIPHLIEKDLIYPIARGREIAPFCWNRGNTYTYGIIPQDSMQGFPIEMMLERYSQALDFFSAFRKELEQRSSLKRYLAGAPFYSCWNVGKYTFAPYKVCWSEISGHFKACILSSSEGRIVVPDHKIYFIPIEKKEEALYLCAFLNASAVEDFIMGYAENTQIGTHITDYLHIPAFNPENKYHEKLVQVAENAMQGKITIEKARKETNKILHSLFIKP